MWGWVFCFRWVYCVGRRPLIARQANHFLLLRQKKVIKEKATPGARVALWANAAVLAKAGSG